MDKLELLGLLPMAKLILNLSIAPAVMAPALGLAPRAGPMRAAVLGLRTRLPFIRPSLTKSQRVADVAAFKEKFAVRQPDQYIVVTGAKGVGKSTVVNTALEGKPGVIFIDVAAGTPHEAIVRTALKRVARYNVEVLDPYTGALRVAKWHKRLWNRPPTVVLRARERPAGKQPAELGSAARVLLEHELCVVVDCSDNSLESVATTAKRQLLVQVEDMPRDVLESIPELQHLLKALKEEGQADMVWSVIGGNPADYRIILANWLVASDLPAISAAEPYMKQLLANASALLTAARIANPQCKEVLKLLQETGEVPQDDLEKFGVPLTSLDKIVRVRVSTTSESLLVPASPAVALVLRYGIGSKPPSLDRLRQVLHEKGGSEQQPTPLK